jgi:hypothetical protein
MFQVDDRVHVKARKRLFLKVSGYPEERTLPAFDGRIAQALEDGIYFVAVSGGDDGFEVNEDEIERN